MHRQNRMKSGNKGLLIALLLCAALAVALAFSVYQWHSASVERVAVQRQNKALQKKYNKLKGASRKAKEKRKVEQEEASISSTTATATATSQAAASSSATTFAAQAQSSSAGTKRDFLYAYDGSSPWIWAPDAEGAYECVYRHLRPNDPVDRTKFANVAKTAVKQADGQGSEVGYAYQVSIDETNYLLTLTYTTYGGRLTTNAQKLYRLD